MTIIDYLEYNAKHYPQEESLVELTAPETGDTPARRAISWEEFNDQANRFANLLISRGLKKGDKVAILMMNCLEWLPLYFGTLKAGCLAVPLNFRYYAREIRFCLDLSDSQVLVFGPEFTERVSQILDQIPQVNTLFYVGDDVPAFAQDCMALLRACAADAPGIPLTEEDDAAIYFSSGTTGFPKAILHSHKALIHAALAERQHHSQTRDDVFLCIPPLYHTGAKMHWFGSLVAGSPAVLLRGVKPRWILDAVSRENCTIVWLLVPWAQDVLDAMDSGAVKAENYRLSQWRLMHIGAQPVPPALIQRWKAHFPHHDYDTNYGLSESIGPGCVHLGVENIHKVGAIGKAGYGWQARIVTEEGTDVPPGTVGELIVKGDGVMRCYYKNEEATRESLKDGWLYTGDMAKADRDGFIYLVDRKKDLVICGGENIYPVQIEDFLRAYPKIKDVAVIGLPNDRLGEIPAAIIELRDGETATEEEINEFCKGMPRYKRPRKILFAPVPRNPTGKIEKPALREKYARR